MAKLIFNEYTSSNSKPWELEPMPDSVVETALNALAEKAKSVVSSAATLLNIKGYSEGITAETAIAKKAARYKGNLESCVTWKGTRPNGHKTKTTGEVAFLNEYGAPKHIEKRMFISKALDNSSGDIDQIIEDNILDWIDKKGG